MTKRKRWPLVLCLLTGLGAAGCTNKEEEQVNSRAKEFAENYFNLRFDKAYGMLGFLFQIGVFLAGCHYQRYILVFRIVFPPGFTCPAVPDIFIQLLPAEV